MSETRSLWALRASTSCRRPFRTIDIVLHAFGNHVPHASNVRWGRNYDRQMENAILGVGRPLLNLNKKLKSSPGNVGSIVLRCQLSSQCQGVKPWINSCYNRHWHHHWYYQCNCYNDCQYIKFQPSGVQKFHCFQAVPGKQNRTIISDLKLFFGSQECFMIIWPRQERSFTSITNQCHRCPVQFHLYWQVEGEEVVESLLRKRSCSRVQSCRKSRWDERCCFKWSLYGTFYN